MAPTVTLVNANEMRPPVGPLALDYVAAALTAAGFEPRLLDLTWEEDAAGAAAAHFRDQEPLLVGLTLRNTDDCYLAGQYSCLPHAAAVLALLRQHTAAPIVVGGCGFSVMPQAVLTALGADLGVAGDGEEALVLLAEALARGEPVQGVPGLVWRERGRLQANARRYADLGRWPLAARGFVDNLRYWREGGQGGFETKRGCDGACIYCADPVAKGRRPRLRAPGDVAAEIAALAAQGVAHLHTCDAEFNRPREHALAVCEAIIERGLAEHLQWWAYCQPAGFDGELASAMRRAGCVGIDFGADHGCDEQLARLGRDHTAEDLERVARLCHREGFAFMFDLLLGAPGETTDTMRRTIELCRRLEPSRVGISAGVRLYPGTPLAARVARAPLHERRGVVGEVEDNEDLARPVFYVAPELGPEIAARIGQLVAGDRRFFCPDPAADLTDYNYRENPGLVEAIRQGHRGAYWDILRRIEDGLPPA